MVCRTISLPLYLVASLGVAWAPATAEAGVGIQREANGCAYASITDALANAVAGDTLLIAPGVYNERLMRLDKDLTLAQSDVACTAIWAGGTVTIDGFGSRVFTIVGTTTDVEIRGVTVRNGTATDGGVIWIDASSLTLVGAVVRDGTATDDGGCIHAGAGSRVDLIGTKITSCDAGDNGGGIHADQAHVELHGSSIIEWNTAVDEGGGLFAVESTVYLRDSAVIRSNTATGGGGICAPASYVVMHENSSIVSNQAEHGGGVALPQGSAIAASTLEMRRDATIKWNQARNGLGTQGGGVLMTGVENAPARLTMHDRTSISNNRVIDGSGGAVSIVGNDSIVDMKRGTSMRNNSGGSGGAIIVRNGTGNFGPGSQINTEGAVFENNSADTSHGGAIYVDNGRHLFVDTDMFDNTATLDGGAVYVDEGAEVRFAATPPELGCDPTRLPANTYCSEVSNNRSIRNGAGIFSRGELYINRTAFQFNDANKGGALFTAEGSTTEIDNSLFVRNQNIGTSGAVHNRGTMVVDHVTVSANTAKGLRNRPTGTMMVLRSISFGNGGPDWHSDVPAQVVGCTTLGTTLGHLPLTAFSRANPLFVATARGSFRLGAGSPAVNICNAHMDPDLDHFSRPSGPSTDMGAFER